MVSEKSDIRKFVFRELHQCSDLSTLTLGILRRRYLEHVGRESLSGEHKQLLKQIVEEELLKMQDNSSDESLVMNAEPSQKKNKRKREEDKDEGETGGQNDDDVVARKKKSRFESVQPDSPDSGIEKAAHEEPLKDDDDDDDKERDGHDGESDEEHTEKVIPKKKVQHSLRGNRKGLMSSESGEKTKPRHSRKVVDCEEEELNSSDDSGKEEEKQQGAISRGQRAKTSVSSDNEREAHGERREKARAQKSKREECVKEPSSPESEAVRRVQKEVFGSSSESEEEDEGAKTKGKESDDGGSDEETNKKKDALVSSGDEMKGKGEARDEEDSQSDSSSLPSLEDEEEPSKKTNQGEKSGSKRKNSGESESKAKGLKLDENKAVSRLKRYIALCGVRRNYKKLFEGCRSVKAKVAVLKKELEELGVEGQPSIEKCKKARLKREEAQELAELDVGNIITTQGRPKRRTVALWPPPGGSSSPAPPSAFKRVVNSDSDSENDSTGRGRKRTTDWSNLKGIISDDADSD